MRNLILPVLSCFLLAASAPDFNWSGRIPAGQNLEIDNVNGPISVSRTAGESVTVAVIRTAKRSDPNSVRIRVGHDSEGTIICALYPNQSDADCSRHAARQSHELSDNNDVRVAFTVQLPAGVPATLHSINGGVDVRDVASPIDAEVVNGHVNVTTSSYAQAKTVNGSIDVTMGDGTWPQTLQFASVNGSIDVSVPRNTSAQFHLKTMNGSISSDFPLTSHSGAMHLMRYADGTIGSGARELRLTSLNGSIRLAKR